MQYNFLYCMFFMDISDLLHRTTRFELLKEIIALENKIDSEKYSFRTQVKNEFGIDFRRPMPRPVPAMETPDSEL